MAPREKESGVGFADSIRMSYTAVVCGDGRILPIVESIGRRVLREIEPDSREGREILRAGRVTLWSDEGQRLGAVPVVEVLSELEIRMSRREHALPRWFRLRRPARAASAARKARKKPVR